MNCPACGASLDIEGNEEFSKCKYCGSTIRIRKRNVNADGSVTLQDKATGMVVGTVQVPFGFHSLGMIQPDVSCYTYPFGVSASACNEKGTVVSYFIGESYTDRSKCPLLSSSYSQGGLEQISKIHYKNFMDAHQYIHGYATMYANSAKATRLKLVEERAMPLYEPFDEEAAFRSYKTRVEFEKQRSGNAGMATDTGFYVKGLCCVYDMTINNIDFKLVISTVLEAWKYQLPAMMGAVGSLGGLAGSLIGSLFGNNQQPQQQQVVNPGAFNDMPMNSVIEWQSNSVFTMQCLPQEFDNAFQGVFTDFCSTLKLDSGIRENMYNMQSQIQENIARHTQQRIDQMNRQFQSWQQIHATQQAAFDSYNRSWWSRTNSSDAARRSAYQSRMAAEDRMSDRYSEAIRGVNTYVRPDGTEVEVSVDYDRAYTNNSGDTLGSRSAFEPGGNWTEMNRK